MSWATGYGSNKPEMIAYSLPFTIHSFVIDSDDISKVNKVFAIGFQFCLTIEGIEGTLADVPELAGHIAKLARLKKRCASRICFGRFMDKTGIDVKASKGIAAYAYDSPEGPAVVCASCGKAGKADIKIKTDIFTRPKKTGVSKLYYLDGRVKKTVKNNLHVRLDKNEVVVWFP